MTPAQKAMVREALAELTAREAEFVRWLNWNAWQQALLFGTPFTPYHAASKARRTLRFSQEHKS